MARLRAKTKTATREHPCWNNADHAEHFIKAGERYHEVNDHGTVMRFCERCNREALTGVYEPDR